MADVVFSVLLRMDILPNTGDSMIGTHTCMLCLHTLQELQMAGINFKAFDLGGHEIARRVWKDYYAKARWLQWAAA